MAARSASAVTSFGWPGFFEFLATSSSCLLPVLGYFAGLSVLLSMLPPFAIHLLK